MTIPSQPAVLRRTKIVATLGPATDDPNTFKQLLLAGVNVVRVNFSHGEIAQHQRRIKQARTCAGALEKNIGILADLQGPKIRIGRFKDGCVCIQAGQSFVLDTRLQGDKGDAHVVGIDYPILPKRVKKGQILLIDDGRLRLCVDKTTANTITCTVLVGGDMSNNKGINLLGGGLNADVITEKDKQDLLVACQARVDYIALSFISGPEDIRYARELLGEAGKNIGLVAKIERAEALTVLDEIIDVADAIMVARGDLGVEVSAAQVPGIQKKIIEKTRHKNKAVITATQMMESMITQTVPTRAEVSDVANAVLDGTDAVMLSAETAVGTHPDLVVRAVANICIEAEKHPSMWTSQHRMHKPLFRVDESIAMAAMYIANHISIRAIIALTESGRTALWMSRIDSGIPIYGFSRHPLSCGKMALYRGVYPISFDVTKIARHTLNTTAIANLCQYTAVNENDLILLTKGDTLGICGSANAIKIVRVGEQQ